MSRPRKQGVRVRAALVLYLVLALAIGSACSVTDGLSVPAGALSDAAPVRSLDGGLAGGDGEVFADGAVVGLSGDAAGAIDGDAQVVPPDANSLCPINPCTGGQVCCFISKSATSAAYRCMASCPGGAAPVDCVGPQQCGGTTPLCCADLVLGSGNVPNCPAETVSSSCVERCAANVGLSCNVTDVFRLCHVGADCASDPANPHCCTLPGSGFPSFVCVSDFVKNGAGLTCSQ